jgi:hypothetical protein
MITPSPTPRRPDQDDRPSMRVRVAASMLRHGRDPHQIAEETGVPLALVQLIDEDLGTHGTAAADPHPPAIAAELLSPQLNNTHTGHSRQRARTVIALALALLAESGLIAGAAITHHHVLGAGAVLLAALLPTVVLLNATYRPPHVPRPDQDAAPR